MPILFCNCPYLSCSIFQHLCIVQSFCHAPNPYSLRTFFSLYLLLTCLFRHAVLFPSTIWKQYGQENNPLIMDGSNILLCAPSSFQPPWPTVYISRVVTPNNSCTAWMISYNTMLTHSRGDAAHVGWADLLTQVISKTPLQHPTWSPRLGYMGSKAAGHDPFGSRGPQLSSPVQLVCGPSLLEFPCDIAQHRNGKDTDFFCTYIILCVTSMDIAQGWWFWLSVLGHGCHEHARYMSCAPFLSSCSPLIKDKCSILGLSSIIYSCLLSALLKRWIQAQSSKLGE